MINIKILKGKVSKNYLRKKQYEEEDITKKVIVPIINIKRLDTTLDNSQIVMIDNSKTPLKERTRIIIQLDDTETNTRKVLYRIVEEDEVNLSRYGNSKIYEHNIKLIEITKLLERYIVPNTTITNYLMYLYSESAPISVDATPSIYKKTSYMDSTTPEQASSIALTSSMFSVVYDYPYQPNGIIRTGYKTDEQIDFNAAKRRILINYYGIVDDSPTFPIGIQKKGTTEVAFKMHYIVDSNNSTIIIPSGGLLTLKKGEYTLHQVYETKYIHTYWNPMGVSAITFTTKIRYDYTYHFKVYEITEDTKPMKNSIYDTVNELLSKCQEENTISIVNRKNNFSIDSEVASKLMNIESPEFTFNDNTLWGMLEQIGNYIHAVPVLKPQETYDDDDKVIPNISEWNVISFDFLGNTEEQPQGNEIDENSQRTLENSATSYLTQVENSFQTNNADYISMTEPFEGGFISTRTNSDDFEISNDNAVFKTSRPIQRITSLWVKVYNSNITTTRTTKYVKTNGTEHTAEIDITSFVREKADYDILLAYPENASQFSGLGTKSTAIYYTRGSNLIEGLSYTKPTHIPLETITIKQALTNIINIMLNISTTNDYKFKDIMYRVKYVPFFNLSLKQYKTNIDEESGENTLFYNQQQSQVVDIESLGNNAMASLLMTSNEEPQKTRIESSLDNIVENGQKFDKYYAYQINEEISTKYLKQTITYHKNFNKWNDYVAIKKNYREWEISERESYKTNPSYNEFCIVSNVWDTDSMNDEEKTLLREDLDTMGSVGHYGRGFRMREFIYNLLYTFTNHDTQYQSYAKPIQWVRIMFQSSQIDNNNQVEHIIQEFYCPVACFTYGNSIVLNFSADDSYSFKNYVVDKTSDYAVEYYSQYGNKFGDLDLITLLQFGSGSSVWNTMTYDNQKTFSKVLYGDGENSSYLFNMEDDVIQFGEASDLYNAFIVNKDSRQVLSMTLQLHFVSDNDNIYINPKLAQSFAVVGNTENSEFKLVLFKEKPDLFLSTRDKSKWDEAGMYPTFTYSQSYATIIMDGVGYSASNRYEGFGLINKNNEIMLYYEYEIPQNTSGTLPNIYFQFRKRI